MCGVWLVACIPCSSGGVGRHERDAYSKPAPQSHEAALGAVEAPTSLPQEAI
jgi:hypothetical protein